VTGILIAVGAMFAGLLLLSWACGDFNRPPQAVPKPDETAPPSTSPS